ncbi:MAG: helix-turn-helix transcriptional regulator [Clostridia bacterium]|nr:helix-turn-helix transcriptional regulator [Clostridia bacterium]
MFDSYNIFQQARLDYNNKQDQRDKRISQEKAAELADTSLSTIKRLEANEENANPSLALKLAEVYNCSKLTRAYCSGHCDIGKYYNRTVGSGFQPESLFEAGYGLINANKELNFFKEELFDILADGKVTPDEVERLRDIMHNLDNVQHIVDVIKDMINEKVHIK